MKNSILQLCALLCCSIIIISCKDAVDSDENVKKTYWDYSKILSDQNDDVIMPLSVGNQWVYSVSTYDANGLLVKSDDSSYISVDKQVSISNEIWYQTNFLKDELFLANTDKGLWRKCDCESNSFLLANFPVLETEYSSKPFNMTYSIQVNNGNLAQKAAQTIFQTSVKTNIPITASYLTNANGIEYDIVPKVISDDNIKGINKIGYIFVKNLGLVECDIYKYDFTKSAYYLYQTYKLKHYHIAIPKESKTFSCDNIDFGNLHKNQQSILDTAVIHNNSDSKLIIYSISISSDTPGIWSLPVNNCPSVINPGSIYNLAIICNPNTTLSTHTAKVLISTNYGEMTATLKVNIIE